MLEYLHAIRNSSSSFARENNLVPIKPVLARIKVRPGKPSSPEMQRLQFPVTLAWACTVHKVQGLTLGNIDVNFDLKGNSSPNTSVVYMKGLTLIRMFLKYFGLNINSKGEIACQSLRFCQIWAPCCCFHCRLRFVQRPHF